MADSWKDIPIDIFESSKIFPNLPNKTNCINQVIFGANTTTNANAYANANADADANAANNITNRALLAECRSVASCVDKSL